MYYKLKKKQDKLLKMKNKIDKSKYNGIYDRYKYPVLTRHHVPISWRFDLFSKSNPHFLERLMVNATFNSGAIYFNNKFYLMVRLEGADRKSVFALASSKTGIDQFEFERIVNFPDLAETETNRYDMRLIQHEDGYIYGIYCAEKKDFSVKDTSSALAEAGIVRTKDLVNFERLPNLKTKSMQQRNVVLHPEFVDGKYLFYTRPQEGFIDVGALGGIYIGKSSSMNPAIVEEEKIVHEKVYHTVYELKNGQGPQPIKTEKGYIHLAHGVRNTAAGLRYVLYVFATDLEDLSLVIARPSGYFIAPYDSERVGDVSNVVFSNGWILKDGIIYIYYGSSDTRLHVATTTLEKLIDYTFNTPKEAFNSQGSAEQREILITNNEALLKNKKGRS